MRRAMTLVETLVLIGIIALLLAMILPAIMQVRESANTLEDKNKLRNIGMAVQTYATEHHGRLPPLSNVYKHVLPYMEVKLDEMNPIAMIDNKQLLSTVDPERQPGWPCSYAANAQAFVGLKRIPSSFRDGLTHTIGFTERYSTFQDLQGVNHSYCWWQQLPGLIYNATVLPVTPGLYQHRPTFADNGPVIFKNDADEFGAPAGGSPSYIDAYPLLGNTRSSIPGLTYQIRPSKQEYDPRIPQTGHAALLVAMMDGSVRPLGCGMTEHAFWSLVTPAGGEVTED